MMSWKAIEGSGRARFELIHRCLRGETWVKSRYVKLIGYLNEYVANKSLTLPSVRCFFRISLLFKVQIMLAVSWRSFSSPFKSTEVKHLLSRATWTENAYYWSTSRSTLWEHLGIRGAACKWIYRVYNFITKESTLTVIMPISVEFVTEQLSTMFCATLVGHRFKIVATRKHVTRWLATQNTKIQLVQQYDVFLSFVWDCMGK